MKCNHCNSEVAEGMKFCPKCGNPISNYDGMKQQNTNHHDVSSKKRNWFISAAILVAIILGLFLLKGILTSKVNLSEIGECYEINGLKFPSYSQLKYIAVNELSHKEVKELMAICGINQRRANGSSSYYEGDCGDFSLQIIDRSNSKDFIIYNYFFHTNNRKYLDMLKSEVMQENNNKIDDRRIRGYIDDYWYVVVPKDIEDGGFLLFFQRFQSKKLNSQ